MTGIDGSDTGTNNVAPETSGVSGNRKIDSSESTAPASRIENNSAILGLQRAVENPIDFKDSFQREYRLLNANQQAVVTNLTDSMALITGAGAGKTHTQIMRVVNALEQGIEPKKIFVASFSNDATQSTKKRLENFVCYEQRRQLYLNTFHGFANQIIQDPEYKEKYFSHLETNIDESRQLQIIDTILENLELEHEDQAKLAKKPKVKHFWENKAKAIKAIRNNKENYWSFVKNLLSRIAALKKEALSPKDIETRIQKERRFIQNIQNNTLIADFLSTQNPGSATAKLDDYSLSSFLYDLDAQNYLNDNGEVNPNYINHEYRVLIRALKDQAQQEAQSKGETKAVTRFKDKLLKFCKLKRVDKETKADTAQRQDDFRKMDLVHDVYKKYQEYLAQEKLYDYDDMIMQILKAAEEHPDFRQVLENKFDYIQVDEAQDTNGAQYQLVSLLAQGKNLLLVGDPRQTIYTFQGAAYQNLLQAMQDFDLRVINSNVNYRSSANIIKFSNQIFARATQENSRLHELTEDLEANKQNQTSSPIAIQYHASFHDEIYAIAKQIQKLQEEGTHGKDIAIICKENTDLNEISAILNKMNISHVKRNSENLFDDYDIKSLINLLEAIQNPQENSNALLSVLSSKFIKESKYMQNINSEDIQQVIQKIQSRSTCFEALKTNSKFTPLLEALAEAKKTANDGSLCFVAEPEKRTVFRKILREFNFIASGIDKILPSQNDFNIKNPHLIAKINKFEELLVNILKANPSPFALDTILKQLRLLQESKTKINFTAPHFQRKNDIELITAHRAKGKEWDHVFIANCIKGKWGEKTDNAKANRQARDFPLPVGLFANEAEALQRQDQAEERRVFYVACTRAKKDLRISSNYKDAQGKQAQVSEFLEQLNNNSELQDIISFQDFSKLNSDRELINLTTADAQILDDQELNALIQNSLLNGFSITPTNFNTFLKCPREFFLKYILKLPLSMLEEKKIGVGNAVHKGLEYAFNYVKELQEKQKTKDLRIKDLIKRAQDEALRFFKTEPDAETKEKIKEIISNFFQARSRNQYYAKKKIQEQEILATEKRLDQFSLNFDERTQVPVHGVIDRLEFDPKTKTLRIIDYKSFALDNRAKIKKDGEIYNQLLFYSLLLYLDARIGNLNFQAPELEDNPQEELKFKNTDNQEINFEARVEFLDRNNQGRFEEKTFKFTKQELINLQHRIKEMWQSINQPNFSQERFFQQNITAQNCSPCSYNAGICQGKQGLHLIDIQ
jgi:DNA helicase-2/ATP-dependent DNA helicase PcrA